MQCFMTVGFNDNILSKGSIFRSLKKGNKITANEEDQEKEIYLKR